MYSIGTDRYYVPTGCQSDGEFKWRLISRKGSDEVLVKGPFNYTIQFTDFTGSPDRLTFNYDGTSVTPTMRTLRRYPRSSNDITWHLAKLAYKPDELYKYGDPDNWVYNLLHDYLEGMFGDFEVR